MQVCCATWRMFPPKGGKCYVSTLKASTAVDVIAFSIAIKFPPPPLFSPSLYVVCADFSSPCLNLPASLVLTSFHYGCFPQQLLKLVLFDLAKPVFGQQGPASSTPFSSKCCLFLHVATVTCYFLGVFLFSSHYYRDSVPSYLSAPPTPNLSLCIS